MPDDSVETTQNDQNTPDAAAAPAKKAAAKKAPAKKAAAKKAPARSAKKAASADEALPLDTPGAEAPAEDAAPAKKTTAKKAAAKKAPAKKAAAKKTTAKKAAVADESPAVEADAVPGTTDAAPETEAKPARRTTRKTTAKKPAAEAAEAGPDSDGGASTQAAATLPLFQAPDPAAAKPKRTRKKAAPAPVEESVEEPAEDAELTEDAEAAEAATETTEAETAEELDADAETDETDEDDEASDEGGPARRRRRRGGRRRRKPSGSGGGNGDADGESAEATGEAGESADQATDDRDETGDDAAEESASGSTRRRRRRRRAGEAGDSDDVEPGVSTVTKVRESRPLDQQITAVSGSTRLEAKKQRRREGREAGRRRAPIVSEAEFLARRESVDRVMVIRQKGDLTQIGVLEDKVLVEHYVARESQTSLIGNIYLGRVQNVLPSMEAAFIDIGKGRNAVLYAGEVNWAALGHKEGQPRKIESVLTSGQPVLVQVTKDPIGHKGARLTSQISLAGRFLVYVPDGTTSGISRKLPDTERNRLKSLLKEIVPDTAGVIVRTAAEGASEEELTRDVERLKARWEDIEGKAKGSAPQLLYGEPDLTLKVVRDLFTEDFAKLVIQGDDAWDTVKNYVDHVAPDLGERLERFEPAGGKDVFATYRVDEQIAKGLDRKVWLPSGGSLIIDRTEAMTVIDVNTGKFTGSGGNLEETVTKNNLEAAEEIVRQLRLRDIGGIIVVDFIDMVLESNRDLVLRRLVECLGRDRTRHQVAEVTSLGLVQMTRKRIGTGLLEAFSENCTHCQGRGLVVHDHPVEGGGSGVAPDEGGRRGRRNRGGRGKGGNDEAAVEAKPVVPTPKDIAAMPRHEHADDEHPSETPSQDAPEAVEAVVPADEPLAEEPLADVPVPDPVEPDDSTAVEPAAEAPAEPADTTAPGEAPKVVTRTRARRGASRAVVSTGEAAVIEAAPVAEPAPVVPEVAAEAPEPPKVVTRTRRGVTREVTSTADGTAPEAPAPEAAQPGDVDEHGDEPHIEHVPVKKKGGRKR